MQLPNLIGHILSTNEGFARRNSAGRRHEEPRHAHLPFRRRLIAYWVTTALLVFELATGGVWDILRVPQVRDLIARLGYPQYFLVILGIWKILGAVALAIPRFPRLKEWAYAGAIFDLTGAVASLSAAGLATRPLWHTQL